MFEIIRESERGKSEKKALNHFEKITRSGKIQKIWTGKKILSQER